MAYIRDTAIILKQEPFREHDAWITLFGETQGKMVAVARGSQKWTAKQLGHLEPFQVVDVMIAKGQAFDKLAVARTHASARSLRQSLPALAIAGALSSFIEAMTRPGLAEPAVFELLLEAFALCDATLDQVTPDRLHLMILSGISRFLNIQGLLPPRDRCAACHEPMTEQGGWSASALGLVCSNCLPKYRHQPDLHTVDDRCIRILRMLDRLLLRDWLSITMPTQTMRQASDIIEAWIKQLPMLPHDWQGSYWSSWVEQSAH